MRLLRPAASLLARLVADLLLILAALTLLLWIATHTRPLSVSHDSFSRDANWQVSLRVAAAHGGLWVLHLSTRPPGTPIPIGLGAPHLWYIQAHNAYDPDARLTPQQTGPRRLGFSTQVRHGDNRSWPGIDPRTHGRVQYVSLEQERITRIPFAAIVAALLILPTLRITLAIRRRLAHRRNPAATPYPPFPVLRRTLDLAALAATVPLAFAIFQWIATRHDTNALSWTTQPRPAPLYATSLQVRRAIEWSPQGWEFSHVTFGTASRAPYAPTAPDTDTQLVGFNIRDDLTGKTLPAMYAPVGATSGAFHHLGFAYTWDDTPMGPVRVTYPPPQIQRTPDGAMIASLPPPVVVVPPTTAVARRTATFILIPHWAAVLLFAIPPALAALHFRRPLQRFRRLRQGLCPDCGYDLRGTPDRCPECGHPATATPTSSA